MTMTGTTTGENGDQVEALLSVTDAALNRLDVDDLLTELTARVRRLMDTDSGWMPWP